MFVSKNALAWGKRLDRFDRTDVTVAQFCRQEGVSQAAFYNWRRKLRGQSAASQRNVTVHQNQSAAVRWCGAGGPQGPSIPDLSAVWIEHCSFVNRGRCDIGQIPNAIG